MKYRNLLPLTAFLAIAAFAPAIFETQQSASEQADQPIQIVAIRGDRTSDTTAARRKLGLDTLCLATQHWPTNNDNLRRSNSPPRQIARKPHRHKVQQNR